MKQIIAGLLATGLMLTALPAVSAPGAPDVRRMKPALLVIDIQNAYLPMMSEADKGFGMYVLNAVIELFRAQGFPIIRVYHTDLQSGPAQGSPEFAFPDSTPIKPDDPMIVKNYPNAFKKTALDALLKEKGVNTVFLCGLSAVGCVLATYHGALDLDYETFMVKDALISHNPALTKSVQEICETASYEVLRVMLENAKN